MAKSVQGAGKVFISHSSVDKPFARHLVGRLRSEGYESWIDEKELRAGDSLPGEIAKAIEKALAIIIVISKASVASEWVHYELTKAAQRMVTGGCRLVPVVIDDAVLPPELTGLLYADCRPGKRGGMPLILRSLEEERSKIASPVAPSLRSKDAYTRGRAVERLVEEAIGAVSFGTAVFSATRSIDFESIDIEVDAHEGSIFFNQIHDYGFREQTVSIADWQDWQQAADDLGNVCGLLVSEHLISEELAGRLAHVDDGVWSESRPAGLHQASGCFVLLELPRGIKTRSARDRFETANRVLTDGIRSQEPAILSHLPQSPPPV
jgi:hypothetical protein